AGADVYAALRKRREQAAVLEYDVFEGGVVGQHGVDNVAVARSVGNRRQDLRARIGERFRLLGCAVVDADLMLGFQHTADHGLTHAARPDESDLHGKPSLLQWRY